MSSRHNQKFWLFTSQTVIQIFTICHVCMTFIKKAKWERIHSIQMPYLHLNKKKVERKINEALPEAALQPILWRD